MSIPTQIILSALAFLTPALLHANEPEMADLMRSDGKIYVVVAVVGIVFLGIVAYLIRIDRKISRIEKHQNSNS